MQVDGQSAGGQLLVSLEGGQRASATFNISMAHVLLPQGVVSGIAIGGVVTSTLSFASQLRASGGGESGGMPTPEDVAPAAFM